jgi:predicted ester cyclase
MEHTMKSNKPVSPLACVFIAVVTITSLIACQNNRHRVSLEEFSIPVIQAKAALFNDPSEANKELVLKMYEEFDRGKLADFAKYISPDFKCNVLGNTDLDWKGFISFGGSFLEAFPDGKHNFTYVIVDGENVVTIGTYTGTHLGAMNGLPPTQAKISLSVMHLDRVVNGKIVEHRGIANQVQFMNQLGIELVPKN